MKGGSCPPSAAGSAASDALENLDADSNQNHGTQYRQRDGKNRLDSAQSVRSDGRKCATQGSNDGIGSSLKLYPLPLKILTAILTAALIPKMKEHIRKPAEKPIRANTEKSDVITSINAAIS